MSRNNIEDIYPLSPMQQGILFHTLYASEPGAYFVQTGWTLRGDLDVAALTRCFQEVVSRHAALRTAFVWEKLDQPMQVVWRKVKLPATEIDLRSLPAEEQAARVARFTEEDRLKGFDLTRAPLMRLGFLRLADDAYRLVWSSHHLLLDGWSTPIILNEAFGLYQAHVDGRELKLERARPYGEYIGWLQKQSLARAEAFWRAQLAGITAPTPIPVGNDRAANEPERFSERRVELAGPRLAALQTFVRQHNLTMSTLLQGAWALVLARYSGEDDVLFGATVSGRSAPVPGIDRMVGLFINTLPVRVKTPPGAEVLGWLKGLHASQGELSELEHSPLVEVQGWSAIPRGTPLFDSLVVYENYPVDVTESPSQATPTAREGARKGLRFSEGAASERPAYPLTVVAALRRTLRLSIGFDERRFDGPAVERMLGHFATLLDRIVEDPRRPLGALSMLSADERKHLLFGLNDTAFAYPDDRAIHELFEAQVDRTPDAVALVFEGRELSYRELDQRANKLAHALRKRGVGPESLVGVAMDRSIEMVVALYGVLKAGGAYVPFDPEYPRERLAFMLEDARAKVVLTQAHLAGVLPEHGAKVIEVDRAWSEIEKESADRPAREGLTLETLAYAIYTSGSTGKPKGAMNAHRGILNRLQWMQRAYGLTESDRVLQKTPFSFDVSVWEFFWPLMFGARLVVAKPDGHKDPGYLAELLQAQEITTIHFVPSMLKVFLEDAGSARCPSLQRVFCSGEALPAATVDAFHARVKADLHNLYGPTEAAVDVTYWPCKAGASIVPIGRPVDNTAIYLLDERGEPVPIGVRGELFIGGVQVGRGYLNRPELTAERFLPDPFVNDGGSAPKPPGGDARMYKTGDVARWLPDGAIEYLGRADFQVKIRGFRIELGEIEEALHRHPMIREAVVMAREDSPGDKRLVGYLVCADGQAPAVSELRGFLKETLPEYMVPAAFVGLAALPLTASGKVDRKLLPAPEAASREDRPYVAPRGPIEETVAGIFAEVLKNASIGAHDDFFELGGHSLLATQVVTRVRGSLGVELPLRALFEAPTPAGLALRVEEALRVERSAGGEIALAQKAPPIERADRRRPLRLSFAQERLWFVDQIDPGNVSYNVPAAMHLSGALDAEALEKALREVVRRHEILRTTIATVEGRPVQVIHESVDFWEGFTDLSSLPPAEREAEGRRAASADARRPFDLARGPMVRARLIRVAPEDHLLLLTMHHIVSDAWTRGIMSREILALYEAYRRGEASPLSELSIQYADYAEWQRGWLSGEVLDRQLAYWKQQLGDAPRVLELPTDRPRPPVQTFNGARVSIALSAEATKALKELSRKEGVTLYMTLLASLDLLLYRVAGQPDVVVGTSIAGRTHAETEKLIGFFINALVLRTTIDEEQTVKQLLQKVRETCLGAYAHQDMPFERLVQELQPEPDRSRAPLFQVIFTMQNAPRDGLALPGLKIKGLGGGGTTVKYDLTFLMGEVGAELGIALEYNTDLFERGTAERMAEQLRTLLETIGKSAEKKVRELSILPESERARLLVEWNQTAAEYPTGDTFHDLFEAQVDRTPDAPALVAGGARLSYRELDARSNQLAHLLRKKGVGAESVVGLCAGRNAELVVGLLGILKAGGAYVPLDPAYPRQRLAQILEEAGATIVVTQSSIAPLLPAGAEIVRVDGDAALIAAEPLARPESEATSSNLAYVLFTSGSTGKPKGVAIEHKQLVNYVRAVSERLALPAGSTYAHVSTFSADLGNTVLFPPLGSGGCLHVIPEELTTDPNGLAEYFAREGIDCLKIVPSHLSALLSAAQPARVIPRKLLVLGGEASSWELIERIERLAPATRILNHYGPTETTVGVLTYPVTRESRREGIVPLGRPLANDRVYVLDGRMAPTPTGVPGEVYIGGAQVARGYLNQPELTAERFVPDPFSKVPGARLYKTGDRARFLPDGTLVFLGRIDFQVKIRGFRIELGEIEAALGAHPSVREAVVLAHGEAADKRLVAYVVPKASPAPAQAEIAAFLEQRLPDYMIPSAFVVLDALPLSPNGKIDRQALSAMEAPRAEEADYAAPRTPTEEVLSAIWADVFGKERVGIDERFSDLGGHSLLAIQIIARARDAFQVQIPLRAIFEAPTIAGLADAVDAAVREGEGLEAPPITRMPRNAELKLSFAQERLWFLDQLEPGTSSYNVASASRMLGSLDVPALEKALREVVRRHEVLRTTFALVNGQPVQVVHEDFVPALPILDLSALPPAAREVAAKQEVKDEAERPFDLAKGPLLRATVVRLGAEDHVLLLTLHHIVSDAQTRAIFQRELNTLYAAFKAGKPSPLPELPIQYVDYAFWQRKWLTGEVLDKQLAYWKGHLGGAPSASTLPGDRQRPPVQTHRGDRRTLALPAALLGSLRELSRREGMTLFMTLLSATFALLHRYTGQEDLVLGTPVLNRTRRETEGLIGFFVNTLVLRARIDRDQPFRELCAQVREACLGGYAHQDIPFERLVQELVPERELSRSPLFQIMFTLETVTAEAGASAAPAGVRTRSLVAPTTTAKFDLMLGMVEAPGVLFVNAEYNTDLFDAATIDGVLRHLRTLLEGIAADAEQPVGALPLLSAEERHTLLVENNRTESEYERDLSLQSLIAGHADRTPDAVAVSFGDERLTYRDLDRRSNQLARHLQKLGVTREQPVGILAVRSIEMIAGIVGILKAGGAYLPLDPDYPADRLTFLREDADLKIIAGTGRFPEALAGTIHVRLDEDRSAIDGESDAPLSEPGSGDDPAYVMYTSGSTGKPKGVCVVHRGIVRMLKSKLAVKFDEDEVFYQLSPLPFDASTFEIWGALLNGGRLAVAPMGIPSMAELGERIEREKITTLFLTTGLFHAMVESNVEALKGRRRIFTGGDVMSVSAAKTAIAALPGVGIYNAYGPTEGTTYATLHKVESADEKGSIPIGRPVDNTQVYVLDERMEPVPAGVFGELFIGGDGLARGYLNRPELTAERFVPSPFVPGKRLYRTGDLVRWLSDGTIAFGGRRDFQVKIRGFRIELGEIETVLGAHPALRECAVLAREDSPGDKRLVAYVVAGSPEAVPAPAELRAFLKEKLPDHMIPSAFVALAELPITSHGKVDRKALPAPSEGNLPTSAETVAPRDVLEAKIVNVWRRVLGVSRVGITDSFFDLGGHSMLAVRMVEELRREIGRTVSLMSLFEAQTIAELSELLRDGPAQEEWKTLVPIKPSGSKRPFFLVTRPNANSLGYIALAKRLDEDQPVYGLQFQYPEEMHLGRPYTREEYEERARSYIEIMRSFQPEGPYLLGGMCEGALIAFVMARQLEAAGQTVGLLAMMDAWPEENTRNRFLNWFAGYHWRAQIFMNWSWEKRQLFLKATANRLLKPLLPRGPERAIPEAAVPRAPGSKSQVARALEAAETRRLFEERVFPGASFIPTKVACPITVLRVRDQLYWRLNDYKLGWGDRTTGGVEVHVVEGSHHDFMRPPHVDSLGKELGAVIRRAHARMDREEAHVAAPAEAARPMAPPVPPVTGDTAGE